MKNRLLITRVTCIVPEFSVQLFCRLPDELLPAISKFLFVAKDEAETNRVNIKNVSQMKEIVQSLVRT